MEWKTIQDIRDEENEFQEQTKVCEVGGGVLVLHSFVLEGDMSESMVFVPGVREEDFHE